MPSGGKDLGSCCALSKSSCLVFVILIHSFVNLPMNTTTEDFHFSVFVLIYRDFCSCSIQLLIGARLASHGLVIITQSTVNCLVV